jgi:hypothetical protein
VPTHPIYIPVYPSPQPVPSPWWDDIYVPPPGAIVDTPDYVQPQK